jgi:prepilin-type processing-associated H-X9-DG protein
LFVGLFLFFALIWVVLVSTLWIKGYGLVAEVAILSGLIILIINFVVLSGVALIISSLSGEPLEGKLIVLLTIFVLPVLILLFPGLNRLKRLVQIEICSFPIKQVGIAMKVYARDNEDQLPTAQNWCDLLAIHTEIDDRDLEGYRESSDAMFSESIYALNKNVTDMKLSTIPIDVVLLFETTYGRTESERGTPREARDYFWKVNDPNDRYDISFGKKLVYKNRWNQVGGPEILTTEYHKGRGCHVLFADGTVKFITTKHLDTLSWEP